MIGSSALAGWCASCLIIPRLGDLYGRKWPVWSTILIAFGAHIVIFFSHNLFLTSSMFFVFGACCSGRFSTAYVWLCELTPPKYRNLVESLT